jgi:hypothetical protein
MIIHNAPAKIFNSEAEAQVVVDMLMADEAGFVFKVDIDPSGSGKAIILVVDEDGIEIAKFS